MSRSSIYKGHEEVSTKYQLKASASDLCILKYSNMVKVQAGSYSSQG